MRSRLMLVVLGLAAVLMIVPAMASAVPSGSANVSVSGDNPGHAGSTLHMSAYVDTWGSPVALDAVTLTVTTPVGQAASVTDAAGATDGCVVTPSSGSTAGTIVCEWPTIAADTDFSVNYEIAIDGLFVGPVVTSAVLTSFTPLQYPAQATWFNFVRILDPLPEHDLAADVDWYWSQVPVDDGRFFDVYAHNQGTTTTPAGSTLTTTLPTGWTFDDDGGCTLVSPTEVECDASGIAAGSTGFWSLLATPPSTRQASADITATVALGGGATDADSADDTSVDPVVVIELGDVDLATNPSSYGVADMGTTSSVGVEVTNDSDNDADDASLAIEITGGTGEITGVDGPPGWTCPAPTPPAQLVTCTTPLFVSYDWASFEVYVTRADEGSLDVTTTVSSMDVDYDDSDDVATATAEFQPPAPGSGGGGGTVNDLGADAQMTSAGPAVAGGPLVARIGAHNYDGVEDAADVEVEATFTNNVIVDELMLPGGCAIDMVGGHVVTCTLGTVVINSYTDVDIPLTAGSAGMAGVDVENTATAGNPEAGNDRRRSSLSVAAMPTSNLSVYGWSDYQVADGGALEFQLSVSNDGTGDAAASEVTLLMPAGFTADTSTIQWWSGDVVSCDDLLDPDTLHCDLGTIPAGTTAEITLHAIASGQGVRSWGMLAETSSSQTRTDDDTFSTTMNVIPGGGADMYVDYDSVTDADDTGMDPTPGNRFEFKMVIGNDGPAAATGAVATLEIPASLTVIAARSNGGDCTPLASSGTVTCPLGTMIPGQQTGLSVWATGAAGTHTITSELSSDMSDPTPASGTHEIVLGAAGAYDLSADSWPQEYPGTDHVRVFGNVSNDGPGLATDVVYKLQVPASMTVVDTFAPGDEACTGPTAGIVTCTVEDLSEYESEDGFWIELDPSTTGPHSLLAWVDADGDDSNPDNDQTNISWEADDSTMRLHTELDLVPGTVIQGGAATARIDVRNDQAVAASDAEVVVTLPAGVTYTGSSLAFGTGCMAVATTVTCGLGDVLPYEYVSIDISVTGDTPGLRVFEADSSATGFSGNEDGPTSASLVVTGSGGADLSVTSDEGSWSNEPGDGGTIQWYVSNNGPAHATSSTFTATIPAGITVGDMTSSAASACTFSTVTRVMTCNLGTVTTIIDEVISLEFETPTSGVRDIVAHVDTSATDPVTGNDDWTVEVSTVADASTSPSSVAFGVVKLGVDSAARAITISNDSAYQAFLLGAFSFTGTHASQFRVVGTTCGTGLAALTSCSVSVVLRPTGAEGARSASLRFAGPDGVLMAVPLSGTGDDPSTGTTGNDVFTGGGAGDVFTGGNGADRFAGNGGNDRFVGGAGKDNGNGGAGTDTLLGGPDNDVLVGGPGNDTIKGEGGNDTLTGNGGRDSLNGGSGNDTINAKDGVRETIVCGGGRDTVKADRSDVVRGCERVRR